MGRLRKARKQIDREIMMMKWKATLPVFLFALSIVLNGCSERRTFSDNSEKPFLSGEEAFVSDESETAEPASDSEEEASASQESEQSFLSSQKQSSSQEENRESPKAESRQSTPIRESSIESSGVSSAVSERETITCTFSIDCKNAVGKLPPNLEAILPSDGIILKSVTVTCTKNETVLSALKRVCKENNIAIESDFSGYVRGIAQLYEKDCGANSGWMYSVNGVFPNVGAGAYRLKEGDTVAWRYTCEYGDTAS